MLKKISSFNLITYHTNFSNKAIFILPNDWIDKKQLNFISYYIWYLNKIDEMFEGPMAMADRIYPGVSLDWGGIKFFCIS